MISNNEKVINLQGLSKIYKETAALKPLDLTVDKNSIFGFLGPNGAGKTTTMKLMLGLIKPTAGNGTIFGKDIAKENIQIRERIGYLPQEVKMYEYMTAREALAFTARFYFKGPKIEIQKRVTEMLELVRLEDKADRPIKTFSGGEKQRLGIAQAQINYPDLLILDEPAASLDPLGRRDVLDVLERLREITTVFYSTHILDDVERVSDTVAILDHGELIAQGPITEIMAGNEGTIYDISTKGVSNGLEKKLKQQSWINDVNITHKNGQIEWSIAVNDNLQAEQQLLRLILENKQLNVIHYGQKQYDLEDIFMNLVENGNGEKNNGNK
ncbi:ABC transporter ATP-binding protein [Candidatus Lokiarchaeum ossiferum]|uniref:ABC transporter ATP-binding protein n=1 Tax=Candidatus Lokiarchaeum ossiferum TaxID=2951803 RepID=UPI00352D1B91